MAIELYVGEPRAIPIVFASDPLVPHGYAYIDIDDISICLKQIPETDADDAYLQKTQTGGGAAVDTPSHTFTMTVGENDYANVVPGVYTLVLAVQVNSPAADPWVELRMTDDTVIVHPDHHRT